MVPTSRLGKGRVPRRYPISADRIDAVQIVSIGQSVMLRPSIENRTHADDKTAGNLQLKLQPSILTTRPVADGFPKSYDKLRHAKMLQVEPGGAKLGGPVHLFPAERSAQPQADHKVIIDDANAERGHKMSFGK